MVVKIATVVTVTVGGMAALSHLTYKDMGNATMMHRPCDRCISTSMYSRCRRRALRDAFCEIKGRRVTGKTMTIHIFAM